MADSVHPEIVVEKSNSFGTPAFAVAIPGMVLLAGLAFAVYWFYNLSRSQDRHLADDMEMTDEDLEDDEVDLDEEAGLEDSLDMEDLYDTDDDSNTDLDEEAGLEDSLDMEELCDTDDDSITDLDEVAGLEDGLDTEFLGKTDEEASRLEDSLVMELFEDAEETEEEEEGLDTEFLEKTDEESRLEDNLIMELFEDTEETEEEEEEEEEECMQEPCLEVYLLRQGLEQMEEEKMDLEKDLDNCKDLARKMENLWMGAQQEIELLRRQLVEKDLLLEKRAQEENEMNARGRKIENLLQRNEKLLDENRQLETDLKLALAEVQKMEEVGREQQEKIVALESHLQERAEEESEVGRLLQQKMAEKERELEHTVQERAELSRKLKESENLNQLLDLENEDFCRQNEALRNVLDEKERDLECSVQEGAELCRKLKETENLGRLFQQKMAEKERELEHTVQERAELSLKLKENENVIQLLHLKNEDFCRLNEALRNVLDEKEKEAELLKGSLATKTKELEEAQEEQEIMKKRLEETKQDNVTLRDNLEIALSQEQCYQRLLECQEEDILSLRKKESEAQLEVQRLLKDCEELKDECQTQKENRMRDEKCFREQLRIQEEALREHDKYMLMMLLHGTAQRNFQLEHIALEHEHETVDDTSESEKLEKCAERTGRIDEGREQDPCEKAHKGEEKQHREFCNAQQEMNEDYREQWEGLKHILEDSH
ncbi:trichohyalin-like [Macrobrachium nipponense]|uniref:trichohyalin-like n=1 Tax=Macrobrachium nipponense TaxID=159736 RepID=UPI0030C88E19